MKNHYLTILSLASLAVLAGCASNGNNQNAQNVDSTASAVTETQPEPQPAQPIDDGIDWEKPLCEIQSNGDTSYRLEYDANGRITKKFADYYEENRCGCIVNYNYDDNGNLTSYVYYDPISDSEIETTDTYTYDSQNRLVETYYGADGGEETSTTKYEGNKSTETRILSMMESEPKKTITEKYFDANNNDTLIVVNSQEEGLSETRISYVSIGGKYLVKSSETKRKAKNGKWEVAETTTNEYNADGTLSKQIYENTAMTSNSTYEYDNAGRLIKSVTKSNYKEDNSSDTDEITYKYTGNCRECSTGVKTYYKRK
ncbi:MAG: RHS repeat protein [Bacteroidales bacterium]|nr:RHS repeat protein [Bacteroidales bacterium]